MDDVGVIHGRFQLLHHGHMEYLLAGKARCRYLLIGISNPDPSLTREAAEDRQRSSVFSNPLTYWERFEMVSGAMKEAGIARTAFDIVPFPINVPEVLFHYVPADATYYVTVYDDWNRKKRELLESLGCSVEIMWERKEKVVSGTQVRERILKGEPWRMLVPPSVYAYVKTHGIVERIRALAEEREK